MNTSPHTSITITTATIVKVLCIILIALAVFYLRDIVFGILTAVVVASAIEPAARMFTRRKVPRVLAVIIIYLIIIGVSALFIYLVLPYLIHELSSVVQALPQPITSLDVAAEGNSSGFFGWKSAVQGLSQSTSIGDVLQHFGTSLSTASGSVLNAISAVFGGAVSFVLIIVISFYLAVQEKGIEEFLRLVAPLKHEEYIINLWLRTQHKIGRWIQGQFMLAAIMGILVFIGLSMLGVKNALFLAFIAMVFEIIPVFGQFIGAIPGILVAIIQGGFSYGIIVALMYLIVQQIESNVIYPLVVRRLLDIPPLVVIIALVVGARVGGFLGILLSVPLAVLVTEYMSDVRKKRVVAREQYSHTI